MVIPRQGSELKAVEEACREASRTVEPLNGLKRLERAAAFVSGEFGSVTIEWSMKLTMRANA